MDYTKYRNKALSKISQYGSTCTLIRKGETETYDPETNTYSTTDKTINGKALQNSIDISLINGTSILNGDIFLMCCFDSEPMNTDKLTFGNKVYTIVDSKPFSPDGNTVIYYDIQARE